MSLLEWWAVVIVGFMKSELPFGSEFSPGQVELPRVLEIAKQNDGDRAAFVRAIQDEYFARNNTSAENKHKLAGNCAIGMVSYGIVDKDFKFTDLGNRLYAVRADAKKLYREFAEGKEDILLFGIK